MRRIGLLVSTGLTGLALVAFASVSIVEGAPIVIHKADVAVSGYFHDRFERLMTKTMPDRTPMDQAMNDVMIRATQLCDRNGVVCDYLASVEAPAMPARKVLK